MVWRKTNPLARQLVQISEVVRRSTAELHDLHSALPLQDNPLK
jgi:hypothetical protein